MYVFSSSFVTMCVYILKYMNVSRIINNIERILDADAVVKFLVQQLDIIKKKYINDDFYTCKCNKLIKTSIYTYIMCMNKCYIIFLTI